MQEVAMFLRASFLRCHYIVVEEHKNTRKGRRRTMRFRLECGYFQRKVGFTLLKK